MTTKFATLDNYLGRFDELRADSYRGIVSTNYVMTDPDCKDPYPLQYQI